jgi:hypothetical protein
VSQRYILPGFGNAVYDPLLVQTTASTSARRIERKKNTIYGEPMGMGYLGNVVPAVVLIFHHLGYFQVSVTQQWLYMVSEPYNLHV